MNKTISEKKDLLKNILQGNIEGVKKLQKLMKINAPCIYIISGLRKGKHYILSGGMGEEGKEISVEEINELEKDNSKVVCIIGTWEDRKDLSEEFKKQNNLID
jgi:hypothetical protein